MRYLGILLLLSAVILSAYAPAAAHHSFAAEFDASKPITLTGKVTRVEWTNPHAFFYIDVKDEKTSEVVNWAAELNSPNSLMRMGWTRDSMKVDDVITVQGSLAKDGSKLLNARNVVNTSNGKRIFFGEAPTQ
ncbi:MAG TPA: DUF6152 family protein [Terriglobia bacterium]|nr:DUF6152 family protein [Terriglobia bacterium]